MAFLSLLRTSASPSFSFSPVFTSQQALTFHFVRLTSVRTKPGGGVGGRTQKKHRTEGVRWPKEHEVLSRSADRGRGYRISPLAASPRRLAAKPPYKRPAPVARFAKGARWGVGREKKNNNSTSLASKTCSVFFLPQTNSRRQVCSCFRVCVCVRACPAGAEEGRELLRLSLSSHASLCLCGGNAYRSVSRIFSDSLGHTRRRVHSFPSHRVVKRTETHWAHVSDSSIRTRHQMLKDLFERKKKGVSCQKGGGRGGQPWVGKKKIDLRRDASLRSPA